MKEVYKDSKGLRYIEKPSGKRYYETRCEYCGTQFFPNREGQKYCSQSCNVRAYRKRKNLPSTQVKTGNKKQVSQTDLVKGAVLGNLAYDVTKAVGKEVFGVKSKLEKDVTDIKKMMEARNTPSEITYKPTGVEVKADIQGQLPQLRVTFAECKDALGNRVYIVIDTEELPPNRDFKLVF